MPPNTRSFSSRCASLARPCGALLLAILAACGGEAAPEASPDASPDGPAWGEAVDGLRLGLTFEKTRVAPGDPLRVTVRAENVSEAPLLLRGFDDAMWWYQVTFERLGDGPDFVGGSGLFIEYKTSPDVRLAPGETWERTGTLTDERRRFLREIPDRQPGDDWDYRDVLPAGRYRAVLRYRNPDGAGGDEAWSGTVASNAVVVEIAPPGEGGEPGGAR